MKARVIATGEIVDVTRIVEKYAVTHDPRTVIFEKDELDFDIEDDPDYWTRFEHQAAIAAMQGLCANAKFMQDHEGDFQCNEDMIAAYAKDIAHALVKKYRKEEKK